MSPQKHSGADVRKPYGGLSRSLVIAIDVGTTFSGVSYAILEPGEIPKIHGVTRFPGQEHVAGNSKIPSVIYYNKYGAVMAAGAEVDNTSIVAQAEDDGWIKAELFKLRLRPRTMQLNMNGMLLSPLPKRKTPVHVFGDFLAYMYRCTRSFICDTHANGLSLWTSVEPDTQIVLSHPNGWEGPQQTRMRNAAVYGKLVPDTDEGRARIRFVTEGEASLHACVLSGLASDVLSNPSKHGFLIADAGGGTLDISAYAVKGNAPLTIEEIAPSDCIFAGSVFVSRRAREFLEEKLKDSKYGTPDSLDHITRKFDETTKRLFRDRNELQFISFGSPLDKDPNVGIRSGQLRLSGNEVANLFEPSVDAAVTAIKRQIEASNGIIRSVFVVGGYAASPWLFQQLQERLKPLKVTVNRPDTQTSKAVADGAVGFYCDHHVSARMSKFMYGVEFLRELDLSDPEHLARKSKLCELPSGPKLLPDAFDCILARSVKVKESMVFTRKYCTELTNLSMLSVFEVEIWCYRGGNTVPKWINRHDENFSTLCIVQANLSMLTETAETKMGKNGKKYWTIVFSVEIHFGLTEFKARIKWLDNGHVKYGPAVIVYNERGHRIEDEDLDIYPEDDQTPPTDRHGSPSLRSHTPINPYYPHTSTGVGSSSSRGSTAGMPDGNRIERSASRGYAPSITPSTSVRSTADRGAYSSDSERKKGRDREDRSDDRSSATLIDRTRNAGPIYGASPSSRVGSTTGGDPYTSTWGLASQPSYPPPVRPPNSRSVSFYDREPTPSTAGGGEQGTANQGWGASPRSAVDEQRQSHAWDNPPSQRSPQSAQLDAILNRPRSPFHQVQAPEPTVPESKSPFVHDFHNDRPKSAFGDVPPSMFGDTGPAADAGQVAEAGTAGGSTSLFGEPPVSVFGETAGTAQEAIASDSWGIGAVTTPPVSSGKKGKKKTSATGTPVSGLASRTSPLSGVKSTFADESAASPFGGGRGSKGASPYDKGKPLSPLNPASQMNDEQVAEPSNDTWGLDNANAGEFSSWGKVNLSEPARQTSRAPSPTPPQFQPEEFTVQSPAEEAGVSTVKKKKKKGSTATTPARSPNLFSFDAEEQRKKDEQDAQKAQEESEKQEAARAKKDAEEKEKAEAEAEAARKAAEEKERAETEAEAARKDAEEKEKAKAARIAAKKTSRNQQDFQAPEPLSVFGATDTLFSGGLGTSSSLNPPDKPWLSVDTGGGDDSWSSFGAVGFGGKTKKREGTTPTAAPENSFTGNFDWGGGGFSETSAAPEVFSTELPSDVAPKFFGSAVEPNFGFDIGGTGFSKFDPPQPAPSSPGLIATTPAPVDDARSPIGDGGEDATGAGETTGVPADEEGAGEGAKKKKKKKKNGPDVQDDAPSTPAVEGPPAEPVPPSEPTQESEPLTTTASKKKKKKK